MKFAQLALLGTVAAIKITQESPASDSMLELDEELEVDLKPPTCPGHPGMSAGMGHWYSKLSQGKNWSFIEPTFLVWLPRWCERRRTSDSIECPTREDAKAVWDIAWGYGEIIHTKRNGKPIQKISNSNLYKAMHQWCD